MSWVEWADWIILSLVFSGLILGQLYNSDDT